MKNGQAERRSDKMSAFTCLIVFPQGYSMWKFDEKIKRSTVSRVKESNFVHLDIGNVTVVMTNNGDVEDLEMTEIFSRWRRFLGDDGDLHESYFLEPGQGWEDEDVDCVTVGDGNTDKCCGVGNGSLMGALEEELNDIQQMEQQICKALPPALVAIFVLVLGLDL